MIRSRAVPRGNEKCLSDVIVRYAPNSTSSSGQIDRLGMLGFAKIQRSSRP
jgi:hypothetical protein